MTAQRSLVIGASGQVGEHLLNALRDSGIDALGTYRVHALPGMVALDLADRARFEAVAQDINPAVIYLVASMANVDYCEDHADEAYRTNVTGTRHAVEIANALGAKLVFFSTDYVFDGENGPYAENDTPNPICVYGRQKLLAEHYIAAFAADWLVVRTTGVYSRERQGKNFIYRLIRTLEAGEKLVVPGDQIGSPTYGPDLARAVVELVGRDARGIYHVCGPDHADRYAFARAAADIFELDASLIESIPTADLHQRAPRPLRAGLRVDKTEAALGRRLVGYDAGLRLMATSLEAEHEG